MGEEWADKNSLNRLRGLTWKLKGQGQKSIFPGEGRLAGAVAPVAAQKCGKYLVLGEGQWSAQQRIGTVIPI